MRMKHGSETKGRIKIQFAEINISK